MNKRLILSCMVMLLSFTFSRAQAPQSFTYQAVARDASGNVLANKSIGLRLSILSNTTVVYAETFIVATNAYGMFTTTLGTGSVVAGNFFTINWSEGSSSQKSLKAEMDPAGGSAYVDMGTTVFNSVPYSLVSDKATQMTLDDLTNVNVASPSTDQVLQWNGSAWVAATVGGNIQTNASLSGNGSSANPLKLAEQNATSGQVLQWNGVNWIPATISGGVGDNWGTQFVQKNVTLDGNGTGASPLKLAQQGAVVGESLLWNGSVWGPGRPAIAIDNVFSGTGTPATPLKLSQQGATTGQVLKWDGVTWTPSNPLTFPFQGSGTGAAGNGVFQITNTTDKTAIEAYSNGGMAVEAHSDPSGGKAISGSSQNGYGIYGSSTNGLAGYFSGKVAVVGDLTVSNSRVLLSNDVKLADQTSNLTVTTGVATVIPGLGDLIFAVGSSASVSDPAKLIVNFSSPLISTTSNISAVGGEEFQIQIVIKQGTSVIKQVNCNDYVAGLSVKSFSYQLHHKITDPGNYTVSVLLFKGNATGAKNITVGSGQVQIQVIH